MFSPLSHNPGCEPQSRWMDIKPIKSIKSIGCCAGSGSGASLPSWLTAPNLPADAGKVLSANGTWVTITGGGAPVPVFAGSATGTVPAATAADAAKVLSGGGAWISLPTAPVAALSTVTKFAYDALAKTLTVAVDGTADKVVNLAALDDEGTKIVINGQTLELQNAAGTVLSSTPIGAIDAQQLTGLASATGYKISLTNGGSVTLTCADIGQMYSSGTGTASTELLSKDCMAVKISQLPIAPGQLTAGALPATVTVSGSSINSPITNPLATIPAANISGTLPASALPATTNVLAIAGGIVTSTVNGIVATATLPAATAAVASTITKLIYDPATKILTVAADGTADKTVVLPDTDAQTLTLTGNTIAISNGNSITLPASPVVPIFAGSATGTVPTAAAADSAKVLSGAGTWISIPVPPALTCADIGLLYPSGTGTASTELLSKDCMAVKISQLPIAPGQLTAGTLPGNVVIPAANITGTLPASALPATTNVIAIASGVITSTVNGIVSTANLPLINVNPNSGLIGDGSVSQPLSLKLDPTSTTNISQSSAGLKVDMGAIGADTDVFSGYGTGSSPLQLDIDPTSTAIITKSPAGLKINVPPAPAPVPSVISKFAFDAIAKTITVATDGTADMVINVAALDDEGTKIVINGQNLELQNATGTVLSSTPIGAIDAQQLTGVAAAAGYKLTLSNGGSVTITCADIGQMYSSGTGTASTELLSKDCMAVKISQLPIAPGQLTAGALPANVTVPAASITGTLPVSSLPPTTNVLSLTTGTLKSVVNGIESSVVIPTAPTFAGGAIAGLVPGSSLPADAGKVLSAAGTWISIPVPPALTCADIGLLYPSGTGTAGTELLSKDCMAVKISQLPIAPGQLTAGALPTNVTVSGSSINSPITNPLATIPAANVTGTLPASALPPTTNVIAIAAGVVTTTVNGVVSTATLPVAPPVTCASIQAAYPAAAGVTTAVNLLTDACTKVKLQRAVSSLGTPLNYWVIAA
jgi:hypothetical protein